MARLGQGSYQSQRQGGVALRSGDKFGVVTEFEFQLHPVGPLAQLGLFLPELEVRAESRASSRTSTAGMPVMRHGLEIAGSGRFTSAEVVYGVTGTDVTV